MAHRSKVQAAPVSYEKELWESGLELVAGVDEAGRGAWAGPVVAAAVIMPPGPRVAGVADSKLLTPRQREELYEEILAVAVAWGVGVVGPQRIAEINILRAAHEAMAQAVQALDPPADFALLDGRPPRSFPYPHKAITDGDARCYSIAAASIVAKVWRDRLMQELDARHPGYGFAHHKGYGTRQHREALLSLGPCPEHRLSFEPLKQLAQGRLALEDRD
ncbi:MAG: ribonuclease HII [Armatimonadetes bacterium]|nr:ribonuclease HII [Armatimonadota bacterium]